MKWTDLDDENISAKHRTDVVEAAGKELGKRRMNRRRFLWSSAGLGVSAVAATLAIILKSPAQKGPTETNHLETDIADEIAPDEIEDVDIIADLDMLEDLEVLEKWEPS